MAVPTTADAAISAGAVVSNVSNVELLETAVKAAPAALEVPNVNAGAASSRVLGMGVTWIVKV